jgi:hypothetical protein
LRKIITLSAALLLLHVAASAQNTSTPKKEGPGMKKKSNYDKPLFQRPLSVSLGLGSAGIGIEGKLGVHRKWNLRLGTSMLPFNYTGNILFEDIKANTKVSSHFNKVQLLAEFKPFGSSFRIVGGLAYFYKGSLNIIQASEGTYKIGNTIVTGEQVGKLDFTADWKGIAPYLGLGLFKDMPKKKFNVSLDLGTYYLSAPKVDLSGTGLLEDNSENQEQLEENLQGYRWLPVLQFNLNYKLQ